MKPTWPSRAPALRLLAPVSLSLTVVTLVTAPVGAAGPCEDLETTAKMMECAGSELDDVNADLAEVYERLLRRLGPERRARLEAAQDAWETFRDHNADFVASAAESGTLYPVLRLAEMLEMTRQRADELRARLEEVD